MLRALPPFRHMWYRTRSRLEEPRSCRNFRLVVMVMRKIDELRRVAGPARTTHRRRLSCPMPSDVRRNGPHSPGAAGKLTLELMRLVDGDRSLSRCSGGCHQLDLDDPVDHQGTVYAVRQVRVEAPAAISGAVPKNFFAAAQAASTSNCADLPSPIPPTSATIVVTLTDLKRPASSARMEGGVWAMRSAKIAPRVGGGKPGPGGTGLERPPQRRTCPRGTSRHQW